MKTMARLVGRWTAAGLFAAAIYMQAAPAPAAGLGRSGVVFMYHRFGEDAYPATNTTIEQLDAHIAELTSGKYRVMPLEEIVRAVTRGSPLPDRAVGLSVDDAFLSVYENAWPRLHAAGLPFTLFVSTAAIDKGLAGYMTWDQIRELRDQGVSIGSQTASHPHLPTLSPEAQLKEMADAQARFEAELGQAPTLIAYPYGEASLETMAAARKAGFVAGLGQHSGVMDPSDPPYYLPRFALNEKYGAVTRVRLAANALPLPASDVLPENPMVDADANPPAFGFTVPADIRGLEGLACYGSSQGKLAIERLGVPGGETRIEVRMETPLPKGRTRINCTMPAREGRWRWFGKQFYVK
jgi:peptidoglycan/xylan/chitin deacetylase (PgdA/CDA1 family)